MKVVLIAAVTADGKIAQSEGQVSTAWTSGADKKFFKEKTTELKVMVVGRKTFATIGRPLLGRRMIVLTHSLEGRETVDGVEYSTETPTELVRRLEKEGNEALAVAGGSSIYSQFLKDKLVHEVYLTVEPVLFGCGVTLAPTSGVVKLKLLAADKLGDSSILLHYEVIGYAP